MASSSVHMPQRDLIAFKVGDSFASYKSLHEKIKQYEAERCVQFTCRDSRTLEMAKKRVPGRVAGANETPTVRGLAAEKNYKLYMETMIFLCHNHYNLNFNV